MNKDEKRDHAARILGKILQDPEFSLIYEDEELSDEPESVQLEILGLVSQAQVFVTWPDCNEEYQVAGDADE